MIPTVLRRVLVGLIAAALIAVAAFGIPLAAQAGAWPRGLGFLGLGILGLWLLQFSRPSTSSDDAPAVAHPENIEDVD